MLAAAEIAMLGNKSSKTDETVINGGVQLVAEYYMHNASLQKTVVFKAFCLSWERSVGILHGPEHRHNVKDHSWWSVVVILTRAS